MKKFRQISLNLVLVAVLTLVLLLSLGIENTLANPGVEEFQYKKKLTFNTTAISVTTNQTNFPICVHINTSSWPNSTERTNFFGAWNVGGKRCQFFDADGTTNLDYEVELYASGTPEAIYWVEVPQVDGNSATDYIWCALGNDPNGTDQDNPTGVWDSNYKAVYHMADSGVYGFVTKVISGWDWARCVMDGANRYIVVANSAGTIKVYSANSDWTLNALISTSAFITTDMRARMYPELNDHIIYGGSVGTYPNSLAWTYNIATNTWASTSGTWHGYLEPASYYDGYFYALPVVYDTGDAWYNHILKCTPANWTTPANWIKVDLPAYGSTVNPAFEAEHGIMGSYLYFKRESASTYWWDFYKWDFASTFTLIADNQDDTAVAHGAVISGVGEDVDHTMIAVALPYYNGGSPYWNVKYSTNGTIWTSIGTSFVPPDNDHENFCVPIPYDSTHILVQCLDEYQEGYSALYTTSGTQLYQWTGDLSHSMDLVGYFVEDGTRMVLSGQRMTDDVSIHYITINEGGTTLLDSTSNVKHGTKAGISEPVEIASQVGKGQDFDGSNDQVTALLPSTAIANVTLSAWINADSFAQYVEIVTQGYTTGGWGITANRLGDGKWGIILPGVNWFSSNLADATGAYHYITIKSADGTNWYLFDNDTKSTVITASHVAITPVGSLQLASIEAGGNRFNGKQDEVRVSDTTLRTDDWIKLEYYSMKKTNFNGDSWISWEAMEATCSPSISLNVSSWNVNGGSPVAADSSYSTGIAFFRITNNSGGTVNITIGGTDMVGGNSWDLADNGTPGNMIYGMYAGLDDADDLYDIIVRETASYNTLVGNLADDATQDFGLKLWTPTVYTDGIAKSGNITLTVACI